MSQFCVSMASGDVSCLAPLRVRLALVDYSCFPFVRAPLLASAARADARFYFFIVLVLVFFPPLVTRGCISLGKGVPTYVAPLLPLFWKGAVNGFAYSSTQNVLSSFSQFHAWVGLEDRNVFGRLVAFEVFCITSGWRSLF